MITSIVLENFKCFRQIEVKPRLITVFVGPNGSGKSSVLQALALLKQSIGTNGFTLQGDLINLAGEQDLLPRFKQTPVTPHIGLAGVDFHSDVRDGGFWRICRLPIRCGLPQKRPCLFVWESHRHVSGPTTINRGR